MRGPGRSSRRAYIISGRPYSLQMLLDWIVEEMIDSRVTDVNDTFPAL